MPNPPQMIIWGGFGISGHLNTGGKYNPSTDSWTATSTTNAPNARYLHTAVWTDGEMILWGGQGSGSPFVFNTGGRYNPSTDSWAPTSTINAPIARTVHTAVWTGNEMIVWGGSDGVFTYFNTGGRYCVQGGPTPTPTATATATVTATLTPTPTPTPCSGRCS